MNIDIPVILIIALAAFGIYAWAKYEGAKTRFWQERDRANRAETELREAGLPRKRPSGIV
jgi:hypothetical protein